MEPVEFEVVPVSVSPVLSPLAPPPPSEQVVSVKTTTKVHHHHKLSAPKEVLPRVPTPEIPLIISNSTEDLPKVDENTELPEKLLAKDHNIELSSEENETKTSSQENSNLILDKTKLEAKNVKAFGEAKPIFSTKFRTLKIDKFWKKKKSKKSNSSSVSTSTTTTITSSSSTGSQQNPAPPIPLKVSLEIVSLF